MKPIYVFDRLGTMIDTVPWPLSFEHTDELSGDDSIDVEVRGTNLSEGQRLVWLDRHGEWREHVVSDVDDSHSGEKLSQRVHAENPIADLVVAEYIDEVEPQNVTAKEAIDRALTGTGWIAGTVDVTGTESFSWYRCSPHDALKEIIEAFGAEYQTHITIAATKVTGHSIDLLKSIGLDRGFVYTYGRNLTSVERSVDSSDLFTALYGYGKSQPTDAGGQQRKLDFASINGGKEYVEDKAATERYGVPNGMGGKTPRFGIVEFSKCEDQRELLEATRNELKSCCQPSVTYTLDAVRLPDGGITEDVRKGDVIHVRDLDLDVRETARVLKIVYDQLHPENDQITFGKREKKLTTKFTETQQTAKDAQSGVDDLNSRSYEWDETSDIVDTAPGEWLKKVMDRLNQEFDSAKTYKFSSFEKGDIWANGPLTADGRPTGNTSAAINLNGLGFRISSKVENGDFVWTTFGTGEGFTASVINVGILRCGDNYLNLDTGEMRIALNATVGDGDTNIDEYMDGKANHAKEEAVKEANKKTEEYLEDYVQIDSFDGFLNMQNVFNALTNGGVNKGFFIQNGQVLVSADAIQTGMILSTDGSSGWDLNSGYFETASSGYSGGQFHGMKTRLYHGSLGFKMDQTDIATLSTYSSGSVHPFGIKTFTDLVLAAPRNIGVSYNATTDGGLSYVAAARDTTMNFVATATVGPGGVTFDQWQAAFRHGLLISLTDKQDTTFSTVSMTDLALVASADTVDQLSAGDAIKVEPINTEDQLMEAASENRMIWAFEPDAGGITIPIYTGEEWTDGMPTQAHSEPLTVPDVGYVDAQASLIQSEIDAITTAIGDSDLTSRLATARNALSDGNVSTMKTAAEEVNDGN